MTELSTPVRTAPARRRTGSATTRVLVTLALVLAALFASVPTAPAASAVTAGCKSDYFRSTWGGIGVTTYSYRLNLRWCWTSGGTIYNVTGSSSADANLTWQVANSIGPTDTNMVPISSSGRWASSVNVYGFFQSRNCTTGSLGWFCSGWTWHKMRVTLKPNSYTWSQNY
jgi:hypothetical protein